MSKMAFGLWPKRSYVQTLTDAELNEQYAMQTWEYFFGGHFAALAGVLAGVAVTIYVGWIHRSWLAPLFGLFGFWCISYGLFGLTEIRGWPYGKELARRYGQARFASYVTEAMRVTHSATRPKTILLFQGSPTFWYNCAPFPHDVPCFAEVHLFEDAAQNMVSVASAPQIKGRRTHEPLSFSFVRLSRPLTKAERTDVDSLLADLSSLPLTTIRANPLQGFPCRIAWITPSKSHVSTASCNLQTLTARQASLPTPRLTQHLVQLVKKHCT